MVLLEMAPKAGAISDAAEDNAKDARHHPTAYYGTVMIKTYCHNFKVIPLECEYARPRHGPAPKSGDNLPNWPKRALLQRLMSTARPRTYRDHLL